MITTNYSGTECGTGVLERPAELAGPATMTRKQVAEHLGVSIEAVKRLDYEGRIRRLPGFGKPVRYSAAGGADFLNGVESQ